MTKPFSHFMIIFTDDTCFKGSSIPKSDWNKIPNKKIERLEYILGNGSVILTGYKQYNILKENLGFQENGISKVLIMARDESKTLVITFDFKTKQIFRDIKPIGYEYGRQILFGWKDGKLSTPKYEINGF